MIFFGMEASNFYLIIKQHFGFRSCVLSLVSLDLDTESLGQLQELAFDMRTSCISTLFDRAMQGKITATQFWNMPVILILPNPWFDL